MGHVMLRISALLLAGLVAVGCDDDDDDLTGGNGGGNNGTFTATVTGAVQQSISGEAVFAASSVQGEAGFFLLLSDEDTNNNVEHSIWFWRDGAGRPGTGSIQLVNDPGETTGMSAIYFHNLEGDDAGIFAVTSGTITFTQSATSQVAGSFQFNASDELGETPRTVSITGTFTAVGGNVGAIPGFVLTRGR